MTPDVSRRQFLEAAALVSTLGVTGDVGETATDARPDPVDLPWHPPEIPLGDAVVRHEIDRETYERARESFRRAVAHGYDEPFDVFVYNHCHTDHVVTVDGEPVHEPGAER